jgi:signal transduction histidine kinase
LRNPITSITGQLEVALLKNRNPQEYQIIINSVLEDVVNVNSLANKLLLIAQLSSNYSNIEKNRIRIDESLWLSRQEIKKLHPDYNVNVTFDDTIDDENKFIIYGNEVLLKTAFINLMENACKYSDNKTVTITICNNLNNTTIVFSDNGIGIRNDELDMIFEPFYRGKNVTGVKGHGIGLSLVKEIINLHNGEISVKSVAGKGTQFTATLPTVS